MVAGRPVSKLFNIYLIHSGGLILMIPRHASVNEAKRDVCTYKYSFINRRNYSILFSSANIFHFYASGVNRFARIRPRPLCHHLTTSVVMFMERTMPGMKQTESHQWIGALDGGVSPLRQSWGDER